MSDEIGYQRFEEGTGVKLVESGGRTVPMTWTMNVQDQAVYARLVDSDLDKIRQIMREALRQDWNEHIPFGEAMSDEEERKWREVERERERRHLEEIRQIVRKEVHNAIFGDPPDPDDLPVRRDADDERVEAEIMTVKAGQADYIRKLEHLLKSCVDFMEHPSIVGDRFYAYAESLCKTARELLGVEE